MGFLAKWGVELLLTGVYLFGGVFMLIYSIKQNKPFLLLIFGTVLLAAGWIFFTDGMQMSYLLFAMASLLAAIGLYKLIRRSKKIPPS